MIQLLKDDAAFPYFSTLMRRDKINMIEVADTMKDLVDVLHTTSTAERPVLNGSSQQFIAEQLGISKSLVSQYLSIAGIRSPAVKQSLVITNASINKAYYISRIKAKSFPEIETAQMAEIGRLPVGNDKLTFKLKAAQMILKNVSGSKSIKFNEINPQNTNAPKIVLENIEKCLEQIAPYTRKVKILSEQFGYCNFLITHNKECKCLCGSTINIEELHSKKDLLIDEISSMHDQVMSEKKYTSLLLLAKKDLEAVLNSPN